MPLDRAEGEIDCGADGKEKLAEWGGSFRQRYVSQIVPLIDILIRGAGF